MYENWKQMQPILDATFERLTSYCYYFYHQTFCQLFYSLHSLGDYVDNREFRQQTGRWLLDASRLTSSVHSLGENKVSIDSRWTLPKIEFIFSILKFAFTHFCVSSGGHRKRKKYVVITRRFPRNRLSFYFRRM